MQPRESCPFLGSATQDGQRALELHAELRSIARHARTNSGGCFSSGRRYQLTIRNLRSSDGTSSRRSRSHRPLEQVIVSLLGQVVVDRREGGEGGLRARQRRGGGDRCGHVALPQCRPSDLVGRTASAQRRERWKGSLHPRAQERHLDQDGIGGRRLGRGAREDQLPACSFLRIKARRGAKKAILPVAASMLTAAYHMLRDGTEYNDQGSDHFDRQDRTKTIRRLMKRLQDLGCDVPVLAHTE